MMSTRLCHHDSRRTPSRLARALVLGMLLFSVIGQPGCQSPQIGDDPVAVDLRELPAGVGDAYRQLTGPSLGLTERTAAAETLIEIDDFEADRALAAALGRDQPEAVWRAVLQAIAKDPAEPPRGLWRPMLAMLYGVDDTMVTDVVTAMGRYDDPQLLDRLKQTALADDLPTRERGRAIAALGHWRTQDVADDLIGLTRLTEAADVQAAAYAALSTLTGIEGYGADRGRWTAWWDAAKRLDALAWQKSLVANYARQRAAERGGEQQLAEQLREAMRALYRASSPEDQPGTLAAMLGEPLEPTRRLALELAQERLIDGQPFNEPLRAALRDRLSDDSAELRGRSAEMLRDLTDQRAAEAIAEKLLAGQEQVGYVLSAYLQVIAQMPQKSAVVPIVGHLDQPGLRADASGALAAIARDGQLAPRRADEVLEKLRRYLAEGQRPSPQMVRLLGRIGQAEEWNRIERWIDDRDDIIRQAAAQAWADAPDRSLEILAERADDDVIQPIVIRAAFDRGQNPATLDKLAANPPRESQFVPAWERALIAMAGRPTISETDALRTGQSLLDGQNSATLVDRFYTAAIDRHESVPTPVQPYHQLRLERAENRLAMDEPDLALADFEYLLQQDPAAVSTNQRNRVYRGLIPAYLQAGRYEPAVNAARAFLEDPANPGRLDPAAANDPLIQNFLDTIRDLAERNRTDAARDLFERFMLLLGPDNDRKLPVDLAPQINTLRERLVPPPSPPVTLPAS